MKNNKLCDVLKIEYPILQAALSWITDANMVAAVSNAGGMGVLGPNAGAKFEGTRKIGTEERLRTELRKIKSLTNKPFALNIILPFNEDEDIDSYSRITLDVAFEEGVENFLTVGKVNKKFFKYIKEHNGHIIHRELTPTPEGAKKAEQEGAAVIIATGYDEGGWIPQNHIGTFSIVPLIVDAVNIPVMAAGGINDLRGVRAAFAFGADGVYVGTRFIASTECPASNATKQDIINSKAEDLIFVSSTQRSTPHKLAIKFKNMYENGISSDEINSKINDIGGLRPSMLEGQLDKGIISVNTAIDMITEIKSCEDIVKELMADFIK